MKPADFILIGMVALGAEMVVAGDLDAKADPARSVAAISPAAGYHYTGVYTRNDAHLTQAHLKTHKHHHKHPARTS